MFDLKDLAVFFFVGAIVTIAATVAHPTRSAVRQVVFLFWYVVIAVVSGLYLCELYGWSHFVDPGLRDYVILAVPMFMALGVMVLTVDLYTNFDDLKDDPAYALFGRSGLAIAMISVCVFALALTAMAWNVIDPTIYERRANIISLTTAGASIGYDEHILFALDQAQKALLLDISDVYRFGLIDVGNNPNHLMFSTACLIYRTFLSGFVLVIVLRLARDRASPG